MDGVSAACGLGCGVVSDIYGSPTHLSEDRPVTHSGPNVTIFDPEKLDSKTSGASPTF